MFSNHSVEPFVAQYYHPWAKGQSALTQHTHCRHVHTRNVAVGLCILMWIYVNTVFLPGYIPQILELQKPLELTGCILQYRPNAYVELVIYAGSNSVMVLAYPFIFYKRWRRQRKVQQGDGGKFSGTSGAIARTDASGLNRQTNMAVQPKPTRQQPRNDKSHGFMVLTLLTCNVFICWTPATVAFLVSSFHLYEMVPVLDPILLAIAMKDLRKSLYHLFNLRIRE